MRELALLALVACGPAHSHDTCASPPCNNDGDDGGTTDVNCPAVHFSPTPTTPSIEVLIDQSASMNSTFGAAGTRYAAVRQALVGTGTGVIAELQSKAYFGATLYTSAF